MNKKKNKEDIILTDTEIIVGLHTPVKHDEFEYGKVIVGLKGMLPGETTKKDRVIAFHKLFVEIQHEAEIRRKEELKKHGAVLKDKKTNSRLDSVFKEDE